jgi:hypothetical protein
MNTAVIIRRKEMGSSGVSIAFRVFHTALGRYVKLKSNSANGTELKLCRKQFLHPSLKEDVVEHCLNMGKFVWLGSERWQTSSLSAGTGK